jgi:hypothetical protein
MFVRALAAGGARLAHARWKLASERIGFRAIIMVKCGSAGFVHHPVRGLTHHSARDDKELNVEQRDRKNTRQHSAP